MRRCIVLLAAILGGCLSSPYPLVPVETAEPVDSWWLGAWESADNDGAGHLVVSQAGRNEYRVLYLCAAVGPGATCEIGADSLNLRAWSTRVDGTLFAFFRSETCEDAADEACTHFHYVRLDPIGDDAFQLRFVGEAAFQDVDLSSGDVGERIRNVLRQTSRDVFMADVSEFRRLQGADYER